jgi:hypothetical protein
MRMPPVRAVRRSELLVVAILSAALSVAACSGDDGGPADAPPSGGAGASTATDTAPPPLETTATMGKVRGQLPKGKRTKVREQVAHAVDEWFDAAYIGGDYPRTDYSASWPGFTTGAKADAEDDKSLMSNFDVGRVISSVEAITRKVSVDVLAVRGHARGATARFVLKFRTVGDVKDEDEQHKWEVRGRLFLTPSPDGWRIFGYDVTKGAVA